MSIEMMITSMHLTIYCGRYTQSTELAPSTTSEFDRTVLDDIDSKNPHRLPPRRAPTVRLCPQTFRNLRMINEMENSVSNRWQFEY